MYTPPLPLPPQAVTVQVEEAHYDVPGRSMRMALRVTNTGDRPVRLGEFLTASIRFVNQNLPAAVANVDAGYPQDVVARNGLTLSEDTDIKPGETRRLRIEATDAAWEIERLTSFLTDVDSKIGGLLFFFDTQGNRYIAEVGGPILRCSEHGTASLLEPHVPRRHEQTPGRCVPSFVFFAFLGSLRYFPPSFGSRDAAACCGGAFAHGGLSMDEDTASVGPYLMHFVGYQPDSASGPKEFCEDIPETGRTIVVLDYLNDELRDLPTEVRIIRDTG
jgi:hypothetical protein